MTAGGAPVVLAVDVGGTSFKGALVDAAGGFLHGDAAAIGGLSGEEAYAHLLALCERLVASARARGVSPLALGLVAPGMNGETGAVRFSSNLGWRDMPLGPRLAGALGLPVAAGHDVRTAGIAEGLLGAGRGLQDFALVMIGTGIAAAFVSNGAVTAGARAMGGELGHAPVVPDGERCPCGQLGCLEAYASGGAIARRYRAAGGTAALEAVAVAAAQAHDPVAARVWGEAVRALAVAFAGVTMMLDPAAIVLGGGLAQAGPVLLDPLRAALAGRLAWRDPPPLAVSPLGLAAGRIGAAILACRAAGRTEAVDRWKAEAVLSSFRALA